MRRVSPRIGEPEENFRLGCLSVYGAFQHTRGESMGSGIGKMEISSVLNNDGLMKRSILANDLQNLLREVIASVPLAHISHNRNSNLAVYGQQ